MIFGWGKITSKAVAYIKAALPLDNTEPSIKLSRDDSPVIKNLENGLAVCYVVDKGDRFQYIQFRDTNKDKITIDELHFIGIQNIEKLARKNMRIQRHESIFPVLMEETFEASLILMDRL